MNVLFMTIAYPKNGASNIYTDLLKEFEQNNHNVYIACSNEKRNNQKTMLSIEDCMNVLRIRTGNLTGDINLIEKGMSTISIDYIFLKAINIFFKDIKFDLILYSTPPITFAKAIKYLKKKKQAKTYLLLKDIFPQNAVDINIIKKRSLIYWYFRRQEKKLYYYSDIIGCMSDANVSYLLCNNPEIPRQSVEVCPNSIAPSTTYISNKKDIKRKYQIPDNAVTFIYGGNLGKPQSIDFLIECLRYNIDKEDRYFIISGNGVEYSKLESFCKKMQPENVKLIKMLPKEEYDILLRSCDVGLIFLDHRFTIPNFPSRLLSYMDYSIPVLACTDKNTDVGQVIVDGRFGWWCESNDSKEFCNIVDQICSSETDVSKYGCNARKYLEEHYTANISYEIIMKHFT